MQNDTATQSAPDSTRASVNPLAAAAAGAAIMYLFDPQHGNRRRKLVRDHLVHLGHVAADFFGTAARDTANRTRGIAAEASHVLRDDRADDRVVEERVRAELGRAVSHPGAIDVEVIDGCVVLRGPVLTREHDALLDSINRVRGVELVEDQLAVHETAANVPALQGEGHRPGPTFELAQSNWSPAIRLLTGIAGAALTSYAARHRGIVGSVLGAGGVAILARSLMNLELKRIVGTGGGREGVYVQKTINISAPRDDVFAFLTDWERWPEWMSHVRSVAASGEPELGAITHWVVDGPAGTSVSWDAEITEFVQNELVSWRSVEGAAIRQTGTLRIDENPDGTIRAEVQMSYNPPLGAMGHAVAKLFGRDPRKQMHEDLARLKTTIEAGVPPHDAAAST